MDKKFTYANIHQYSCIAFLIWVSSHYFHAKEYSIFLFQLFREVKEVFPQFRKKVEVVEGDIVENRLGLSFEDYEKIRQNVTIVIHSAASVNFNDPIKYVNESYFYLILVTNEKNKNSCMIFIKI